MSDPEPQAPASGLRLRVWHFFLFTGVYAAVHSLVGWQVRRWRFLEVHAELSVLALAMSLTSAIDLTYSYLRKKTTPLPIDGLVVVPWSLFVLNVATFDIYYRIGLFSDEAFVYYALPGIVLAGGLVQTVSLAWWRYGFWPMNVVSIFATILLFTSFVLACYEAAGGESETVFAAFGLIHGLVSWLFMPAIAVASIAQLALGPALCWSRWLAIAATGLLAAIEAVYQLLL